LKGADNLDDNTRDTRAVDLLIIGGGASGALAALGAVSEGNFRGSVEIVEKEKIPFRKLLASGNGRCNLANLADPLGHYHGSRPSFVNGALFRMPARELLSLFERLGLMTFVDHAERVYPRSMQSKSVVIILRRALSDAGISVNADVGVLSVERDETCFRVQLSDQSSVRARSVIVAAGSPASPQLGGSDSGVSLLRSLGHTICEPLPALVPLRLRKHDMMSDAEGVRFRGSACFESFTGVRSPDVSGEFLITSYGLSGIAAMELGLFVSQASRDSRSRGARGGRIPAEGFRQGRGEQASKDSETAGEAVGKVIIDFLPEMSSESLRTHLESHRAHEHMAAFLSGVVPEKIARVILTSVHSDPHDPLRCIAETAGALKGFALEVEGTRGFEFAQVASGGAVTDEFDSSTMMSRIVPGLFACGEVLDIDGDTGGFNLLWAFSSGYLAGRSSARYLTAR